MLTCKMEGHDRLERFVRLAKFKSRSLGTKGLTRGSATIDTALWMLSVLNKKNLLMDEKSNQVIQGNCYMQQLPLTPDVQSLPGHSSLALHTTRSGILFYVTLSDLDASVRSCFQNPKHLSCLRNASVAAFQLLYPLVRKASSAFFELNL
ncbi:hypothetical protein EMCRGX_G016572 [Ephydatia muelleri]